METERKMITKERTDTFELYNHPDIYDIAFSWDLSEESTILQTCLPNARAVHGETRSGASLWNRTHVESPGRLRVPGDGL